jgi:hypothetical protein
LVTIFVSLLTKPPKKEKVEGITWESDFESMVGAIVEERAETKAMRVTEMAPRKITRPPWYLNLKYWATAILLVQVLLLFFFG